MELSINGIQYSDVETIIKILIKIRGNLSILSTLTLPHIVIVNVGSTLNPSQSLIITPEYTLLEHVISPSSYLETYIRTDERSTKTKLVSFQTPNTDRAA